MARSARAGSAFRGLRDEFDPAFSLVDAATYATTAFEDVLFENNTATGTQEKLCKSSPQGVVGVQAENACEIPTAATLRGCTFRGNFGAPVATLSGTIFSDVSIAVSSLDDNGCGAEEAGDPYDGYDDGPETDACSVAAWREGLTTWAPGSPCPAVLEARYDAQHACNTFPRNQSWPLAALPTAHTPWRPGDYLSSRSAGLRAIKAVRAQCAPTMRTPRCVQAGPDGVHARAGA